jgi:hypothetical protein
VRRENGSAFHWVQVTPGERFSQKLPKQSWTKWLTPST